MHLYKSLKLYIHAFPLLSAPWAGDATTTQIRLYELEASLEAARTENKRLADTSRQNKEKRLNDLQAQEKAAELHATERESKALERGASQARAELDPIIKDLRKQAAEFKSKLSQSIEDTQSRDVELEEAKSTAAALEKSLCAANKDASELRREVEQLQEKVQMAEGETETTQEELKASKNRITVLQGWGERERFQNIYRCLYIATMCFP